MAAPFELTDDSVVVVIGTGAGGGVLSNELAQKGVSVVALEAGGRHYPRTSSTTNGKASANLPGWTRARPAATGAWPRIFPACPPGSSRPSAAPPTHWAGASLRFQEHEWKAADHLWRCPGREACWTGPSTAAEMAPWYELAEAKLGVTRTGDRAGLPGNNNFKVFESRGQGARLQRGPYRPHGDQLAPIMMAAWPVNRPASASRAANGGRNGRLPVYVDIPQAARPRAIWRCGPTCPCRQDPEHGDRRQGQRRGRVRRCRRQPEHKQMARAWSAWRATRSKARGSS